MNEDKVCCVCNEHKRFLARINGGRNYYCMKCSTKIRQSGMKYFKDCSFVNFLESINDDKPRRPHSNTPIADGLRRTLAEMGIDARKKLKKDNK
ncbi:MAG: hypothetical protein OPY05_03590 [Nitrosopumilus sp.]|nr:hypothetical protein [Nitrosopumilus sp.]